MTGKTLLENHNGLWVLEETTTDQVYGNTLLTNKKPLNGNIAIKVTAQTSSYTVTYSTASVSGQIKATPKLVVSQRGWINEGTYDGPTITASQLVSGTATLSQQTGTDVTNKQYADVRSATFGASVNYTIDKPNHQVTFTPRVVVTQSGWVETGKTGTAVTITASQLTSGTKTVSGVTTNENIDNYKYLTVGAGAVTPTVDSLSSPTVNITGSAVNMATVDSSTYYVQLGHTKNDGSVKAKETRSAGWVEAGNSSSNASTITPVINGSGDKVYIQGASVTATLSYDNSTVLTFTAPSPTMANNTSAITGKTRLTATLTTVGASVTTDYYIAVRPTVSNGSTYTLNGGTITGNMDISQEGYITNSSNLTPTLRPSIIGRSSSKTGLTYYLQIPSASPTSEVSSLSSPTVALSGVVTGMSTLNGVTSNYYIEIKGTATNGSVKSTYKNSQMGWAPENSTGTEISDATAITPNITNQNTKIYIREASLGASGEGSASFVVAPGDLSVVDRAVNVSGKTRLTATLSTATTGIDTYFMRIRPDVSANATGATGSITGSVTASVSVDGYAPSGLTGGGNVTGVATATTSAKNGSDYYIAIPSATPTSAVSNLSSPTVAVGATTSLATASSGDYYIEVLATPTNGSVKSKYTNSQAGWAPINTGGTETSATTITPNVTGSGTKIYLKTATFGMVSSSSATPVLEFTPSNATLLGYAYAGYNNGALIKVNPMSVTTGSISLDTSFNASNGVFTAYSNLTAGYISTNPTSKTYGLSTLSSNISVGNGSLSSKYITSSATLYLYHMGTATASAYPVTVPISLTSGVGTHSLKVKIIWGDVIAKVKVGSTVRYTNTDFYGGNYIQFTYVQPYSGSPSGTIYYNGTSQWSGSGVSSASFTLELYRYSTSYTGVGLLMYDKT